MSLNADDYARVCAIASRNRPPLPVRYVIELAVVEFLDGTPKGTIPDVNASMRAVRQAKATKR